MPYQTKATNWAALMVTNPSNPAPNLRHWPLLVKTVTRGRREFLLCLNMTRIGLLQSVHDRDNDILRTTKCNFLTNTTFSSFPSGADTTESGLTYGVYSSIRHWIISASLTVVMPDIWYRPMNN